MVLPRFWLRRRIPDAFGPPLKAGISCTSCSFVDVRSSGFGRSRGGGMSTPFSVAPVFLKGRALNVPDMAVPMLPVKGNPGRLVVDAAKWRDAAGMEEYAASERGERRLYDDVRGDDAMMR